MLKNNNTPLTNKHYEASVGEYQNADGTVVHTNPAAAGRNKKYFKI